MIEPFSLTLFEAMPIIGIMRNIPPQYLMPCAQSYYKAGLTCLEITMNSPGAAENIAELANTFAGRLNIGAGTVCTMADLDLALKANAQFIVTPIINDDVIKTCVAEGIPIFPGAYTPTEIYHAWSLGATMVKVFPAGTLGPEYVKEVLGPLNQIKLIPTGGIGLNNMREFFKAGAKGVGIGSHLFPKNLIETGDWDTLCAVQTAFKDVYQAYLNEI